MTGDQTNLLAATVAMVIIVPMFVFCIYGFLCCPCSYDAISVGSQVYAFLALADTRARIKRRMAAEKEVKD